MKKHFRLFLLYFAQYAKVRLAYKADFFIAFFSSMAATVLGFGFVWVLFSKIPKLQDWSFYEILFLYGFSLIPLGMFNVVSWNLYEFGDLYIIQGRFDRILLRPADTLFQVIFEKFRLESLQEVVTGTLVVALCVRRLHLAWKVADSFWFLLMVICGAVIYLAVFLILTSVSFWFEDRVGIVPPVFNMLTFGRYPLTIYNVFIPVPSELDHPLRLCLVLPHNTFPWSARIRSLLLSRAGGGSGFLPALHICLEQGRGKLQQHGIVMIAEQRRLVTPPQGRLRSKGESRRGHSAARFTR